MYRKTIEHPDYLPVEVRKHTDFESGKTMGRVWRVVRDDLGPDELRGLRRVDFVGATNERLCEALRDPDGWRRDTVHRHLLERRDRASAGPLRSLAADPEAPPAAVVHALHLLDNFGALDDDLLRRLLGHPAAPVRENALQPAEARLAREPGWLADVLRCADDPDARVRFQAAIALGSARPPSPGLDDDKANVDVVAAALARVAARDGADRWARAAVFSTLAGREQAFLAALRDRPRGAGPLSPELLGELGRLLGSSRPASARPELLQLALRVPHGFTPEEQAALITGLAEAVRGRLGVQDSTDVLSALAGPSPDRGELEGTLRELVAAMTRAAFDPARPLDSRRTAVGLLAFASFDQAGEVLLRLVDPQQPPALQAAAASALGTQRDARAAAALLEPGRFVSYTPALRDEVLSAVVSQSRLRPVLLSALERGGIPVGAIDASRRRQIVQDRDDDVRRRAAALFGAVPGDRAGVYEAYKGVVDLPADPSRGRAVFRRECASCHRLDREGFAVGPDLFGIRNQPKPAILLHILAPDLEITQGFGAYTVATRDGRVLTGLIASETPTSLTLRQPLGKEDTVLRDDVEEIASNKQSLMPTGLEKTVTRQEFADLLAYLKGEGTTPRENAR
jgi:putative heme-binding domain-containing protein